MTCTELSRQVLSYQILNQFKFFLKRPQVKFFVGVVQAKIVSSRLFLVKMVPGLCWASGWLVNSGGHVDTGLSRMACFKS